MAGADTPIVREPDPEHCECGGTWQFDPTLEGETCGGLHLAGWLVCDRCSGTRVTRRGVPSGRFQLAKSGRSLDADGFRVRAEGQGDPTALMLRLARVPALEAALRRIAAGATEAAAIAREALE